MAINDRERPRIMLLHYTAPPTVGGVENVMARHARLLQQNGYDVQVVAGAGSAKALDSNVELIQIPELDSRHPQNRRVNEFLEKGIVHADFEVLVSKIAGALEPLVLRSELVIAHNVFNFHFNLPLVVALHRLLEQGAIRHALAWCHDISRYVNPASGAVQRTGFPWELLGTYSPQVTYVAVSPQRRHTLAGILHRPVDEIAVIPNGVEPALFLGLGEQGTRLVQDLDLLSADLILLMPVRITLAKNIEFAIRVTAALVAHGLRVKLLITGPPDPHADRAALYFHELERMCDTLALQSCVHFLFKGTVSLPGPRELDASQTAELYRVCDVVLMPSHREGFGLPILEAGMANKPVFCTDLPVLDLVPRDDVYLMDRTESPEQVAVRLVDWTNQDPAHRLCRRVRQEFTWGAVFERDIKPLVDRCLTTMERV